MNSIFYKNRQFLVLIFKILVVVGAFFFIYNQIANNDKLDWKSFNIIFQKNISSAQLLFIVFLSFLNRFLEILKWQNLVQSFKYISIAIASKQVLAALTAGIFTPNGVGEYAGKALYFDKTERKKIIFLNLICNGVQMLLSVFFGILGLFFLGFTTWGLLAVGLIMVFSALVMVLKKIKIKGFSMQLLLQKINAIPTNIHHKNILLAVARYFTFSHQYYFLFVVFGVQLPYFTLMATVAAVYFIASSLPTFQVFDFAIKGGVAVFFFSLLAVNEWIVVFISTIMWFLNVVIPVVIGSYFVIKFKPKWY